MTVRKDLQMMDELATTKILMVGMVKEETEK